MRALAALAALFLTCCVAFGVLDVGKIENTWRPDGTLGVRDKREWVPVTNNKPAELCYVCQRFREDIAIADPPPHVNKFISLLRVVDVLGGNWRLVIRWRNAAIIVSARAYKSALLVPYRIVEMMPNRKFGVSDLTSRFNANLFCFRVAAVLPERSESPIVKASYVVRDPIFVKVRGKYERGFVRDKCFLGQSSLSPSHESENDGKDGDYESGYSTNSRVLILDKKTNAISVNLENRESGNTVIRGLLLVLVLIGLYAIFVRL